MQVVVGPAKASFLLAAERDGLVSWCFPIATGGSSPSLCLPQTPNQEDASNTRGGKRFLKGLKNLPDKHRTTQGAGARAAGSAREALRPRLAPRLRARAQRLVRYRPAGTSRGGALGRCRVPAGVVAERKAEGPSASPGPRWATVATFRRNLLKAWDTRPLPGLHSPWGTGEGARKGCWFGGQPGAHPRALGEGLRRGWGREREEGQDAYTGPRGSRAAARSAGRGRLAVSHPAPESASGRALPASLGRLPAPGGRRGLAQDHAYSIREEGLGAPVTPPLFPAVSRLFRSPTPPPPCSLALPPAQVSPLQLGTALLLLRRHRGVEFGIVAAEQRGHLLS